MKKGFTLVELAIVITIIGLLIGGVLKGQELLENARMTSSGSQMKGYNSAVLTFRDIYKALPGDIANPSNFLQNCTTAPCNVSGDANGLVGITAAWELGDENNNFWMHLAKAGLVNGVDPNATWTASTRFGATAPPPAFAMGGRMGIGNVGANWGSTRYSGVSGHVWHGFATSTTSSAAPSLRHDMIAKYDLKFDDGKPNTGDVLLLFTCPLAADNVSYNPNLKDVCYIVIRPDF